MRTTYQMMQKYQKPFERVRSALGLEENVGFACALVAHRTFEDFPFSVAHVRKENDIPKIQGRGMFPEWYEITSTVKGSSPAGAMLVNPNLKEHDIGWLVSFYWPKGWLEPEPKHGTHMDLDELTEYSRHVSSFHPLFEHLPLNVFEGGLMTTLARLICWNGLHNGLSEGEKNPAELIRKAGYERQVIAFSDFFIEQLKEYFATYGFPEISEADIEDRRNTQDISAYLRENKLGIRSLNEGKDKTLLKVLYELYQIKGSLEPAEPSELL